MDKNELPTLKLLFALEIVASVELLAFFYTSLFLLYLLLIFTRTNPNSELQDNLLRKRVPNIVAIMNQKLVKEAIKS